jgi:hypothetical protein
MEESVRIRINASLGFVMMKQSHAWADKMGTRVRRILTVIMAWLAGHQTDGLSRLSVCPWQMLVRNVKLIMIVSQGTSVGNS